MNDDLTPWEQKELEEERESLRLQPEWDKGEQDRILKPNSAPYPPAYDPGPSVKPDVDRDRVASRDDG